MRGPGDWFLAPSPASLESLTPPWPPLAPASNRFFEGEKKQSPPYKCLIGN
jgi:hypothetical protein